jgi:hypothetical protein
MHHAYTNTHIILLGPGFQCKVHIFLVDHTGSPVGLPDYIFPNPGLFEWKNIIHI